jgi:hypothetical protein
MNYPLIVGLMAALGYYVRPQPFHYPILFGAALAIWSMGLPHRTMFEMVLGETLLPNMAFHIGLLFLANRAGAGRGVGN